MEGLPQELQFQLKDDEELLHNMEKSQDQVPDDINMEIIDDEPVKDVVELDVPDIKKEEIKTEDIFMTTEPAISIEAPISIEEAPVKLNKNGKPRKKRVYTEEQREAMRVRMLNARAQRGKNDKIKKEKKEKEKKHKELKEKTIEHEIAEMENKLVKKINPQPTPQPAKQSFSQKDLEDAQLNAIVQYEKIRKTRKQKKHQEQLIQQEKEALKNLVKREMNQTWEQTAGKYSGCY